MLSEGSLELPLDVGIVVSGDESATIGDHIAVSASAITIVPEGGGFFPTMVSSPVTLATQKGAVQAGWRTSSYMVL